jgi:hypothetical protein
MACLLCSTAYHLFLCRSEATCSDFQRLDYGMVFLVVHFVVRVFDVGVVIGGGDLQ